MWAMGPPNAVSPSRRKAPNTSPALPGGFDRVGGTVVGIKAGMARRFRGGHDTRRMLRLPRPSGLGRLRRGHALAVDAGTVEAADPPLARRQHVAGIADPAFAGFGLLGGVQPLDEIAAR